MKTISLNGIWSLSGRPEEGSDKNIIKLSGEVPGCVQLDLSREGILPKDLFFGKNILETEKFEGYEWCYERRFTAPIERENIFLVFEGVDCIAEYFLNGEKIGESENMLIAHEFDVGKYLRDGENTLTVLLHSASIDNFNRELAVSNYPFWLNSSGDSSIRRAPHSYGWDIMPRAVCAGLWREVRLEVRDSLHFSQLFVQQSDRGAKIFCAVKCKYSVFSDIEIEFEGSCGEDSSFIVRKKLGKNRESITALPIKNPKMWFPYGYGEPNIYDGTARIYKEGELVHEEAFSFGLRSVTLDRTDTTDGENGRFRFLINGIEVMCKGSNWVPMDPFHSRDASRYDKALELVRDIGCNILRCWGGNVYEDHKFFDFCDRHGIMVWQDFAMACAVYPQDERFKKLITDEATAVVKKLRNHPSIILWSGDNEIDLVYYGAGLDPADNKITRQWLPDVVHQHDIGRPYLPSSPYLSPAAFSALKSGSAERSPEDHLWGARDYYKSDYYKNSTAHFVSECGYHGCPSIDSIRKFISPEKVWPYRNNDEWILHSSDQRGNDSRVMLMEKQIRQLFGKVPADPEAYILASQISQAEAKKFFIEHMRVGRPKKCGIIWWNLLDGWPQMSDAVVDYYYTKKLAYHYIKRSQAPFAICADEIASWGIRFFACNDTLEAVCGRFTVKDAVTDELLLDSDFSVGVNRSAAIAKLPIFYSEQRILIIKWEANGKRGMNHYLCGYPPIDLEMYTAVIKKYDLGS